MATNWYSPEMLQAPPDSLDVFRQRAICAICREFFSSPKRLDCGHVFCLDCLCHHLQVRRHVNFPPCPMCRRPITKPRAEVIYLEPARAEEEIADYVKRLEICDICSKKENPRSKCLDCTSLICDNCKPSHSAFRPAHLVVSIAELSLTTVSGKDVCALHGHLPLYMFCIMCETPLCIYCALLDHDECNLRWTQTDVQERYEIDFLQYVAHSVEKEDENHVRTRRLVWLKELAAKGRQWIEHEAIQKLRLHEQRVTLDRNQYLNPGTARDFAWCINFYQALFISMPSFTSLDGKTDKRVLQDVFHIQRVLNAMTFYRPLIFLLGLSPVIFFVLKTLMIAVIILLVLVMKWLWVWEIPYLIAISNWISPQQLISLLLLYYMIVLISFIEVYEANLNVSNQVPTNIHISKSIMLLFIYVHCRQAPALLIHLCLPHCLEAYFKIIAVIHTYQSRTLDACWVLDGQLLCICTTMHATQQNNNWTMF